MKSLHMHTPAPVASLLLVGAPPGCLPHTSSSTLSQFFMVSPVKTGMSFEIFDFFTVGPHPYHPPTMLSPRVTTCAPLHTFSTPCAPSHPCTLLHPIFQG